MDKNQMIKAVLDNFQGVIVFKDLNGKYIDCGKECLESFKSDASLDNNPIGKTDHEIGFKFVDEYRKNDLKVINSGKAMSFHEKYGQSDEVVSISSLKFPVFNDENEIIGIGIMVEKF